MAIKYPSAVYKKNSVSVVDGDAASKAPVSIMRTGFFNLNNATITTTVIAIKMHESKPITQGRSQYELIPHASDSAHLPEPIIFCVE